VISSRTFKKELFAEFARIGKALSSGNRLELPEFLAQGKRSVEALAKISRVSVTNTSQHLQQLRQAGLATTRRDGQRVSYALAGDEIAGLPVETEPS
jgi:DNA-binding transcriptional ArsR family regulator